MGNCSLPLFVLASGDGLLSGISEEGKVGPLLFRSVEAAQRYRHSTPDAHHFRIYVIKTPTRAMLLSGTADHLFLHDNETINVVTAEQFAQMFGMRDGQNRHRNRR